MVVETVAAVAVPPFTVVQVLSWSQRLVYGEAEHMLDLRVDERRIALVAVQTSDAAARTIWIRKILQQRCRILTDATGIDDVQVAVILKLLAGCGIEDGDQVSRTTVNKIPKIARLLQRRGNGRDIRILVVLLEPLLAVVEEGSVASVVHLRNPKWTTDRKAVVVLVVGWRMR